MVTSFLLEMRGIAKSFNRNPVLRDVSLSVGRGEVHALMGENGAGKSTLMKILMGMIEADAGESGSKASRFRRALRARRWISAWR